MGCGTGGSSVQSVEAGAARSEARLRQQGARRRALGGDHNGAGAQGFATS
jgi:hypothetical protein